MSYILEALRRADAERARGAVPGLNTPAPEPVDDEAAAGPRPWRWLAAGVVVALGLVAAWRWVAMPDAPQAPLVATAPLPVTALPETEPPSMSPPTSSTPALPSTSPTPTPTPAQAQAQAQAPAPTARLPGAATSLPKNSGATRVPAAPNRGVAQASPAPGAASAAPAASSSRNEPAASAVSRRAATAPDAAPRKPTPVAAAAAPAPAPPAKAEPAPRIYRQAELPDEIRRALPRLAIGGSIYSDSAASRMIVINGQVLHEGDKLGADLSLRQIRLKEAVMEFRGYRFEVPY